jgi:hypothetical protein
MEERRTNRSTVRQHALTLFLEEARQRLGTVALALTSPDGLFIAGSGEGDLEELGALGAGGRKTWNGHGLHVLEFTAAGEALTVTAAGRQVPAGELEAGLERIIKGG